MSDNNNNITRWTPYKERNTNTKNNCRSVGGSTSTALGNNTLRQQQEEKLSING
jgi:hypothetical protein